MLGTRLSLRTRKASLSPSGDHQCATWVWRISSVGKTAQTGRSLWDEECWVWRFGDTSVIKTCTHAAPRGHVFILYSYSLTNKINETWRSKQRSVWLLFSWDLHPNLVVSWETVSVGTIHQAVRRHKDYEYSSFTTVLFFLPIGVWKETACQEETVLYLRRASQRCRWRWPLPSLKMLTWGSYSWRPTGSRCCFQICRSKNYKY